MNRTRIVLVMCGLAQVVILVLAVIGCAHRPPPTVEQVERAQQAACRASRAATIIACATSTAQPENVDKAKACADARTAEQVACVEQSGTMSDGTVDKPEP